MAFSIFRERYWPSLVLINKSVCDDNHHFRLHSSSPSPQILLRDTSWCKMHSPSLPLSSIGLCSFVLIQTQRSHSFTGKGDCILEAQLRT
jgi:hypothetical protein